MQGTAMERSKLQVLATELAKDIKTEAVLNALSRELLKLTVETALNAESAARLPISVPAALTHNNLQGQC